MLTAHIISASMFAEPVKKYDFLEQAWDANEQLERDVLSQLLTPT